MVVVKGVAMFRKNQVIKTSLPAFQKNRSYRYPDNFYINHFYSVDKTFLKI